MTSRFVQPRLARRFRSRVRMSATPTPPGRCLRPKSSARLRRTTASARRSQSGGALVRAPSDWTSAPATSGSPGGRGAGRLFRHVCDRRCTRQSRALGTRGITKAGRDRVSTRTHEIRQFQGSAGALGCPVSVPLSEAGACPLAAVQEALVWWRTRRESATPAAPGGSLRERQSVPCAGTGDRSSGVQGRATLGTPCRGSSTGLSARRT